MNKYVLFLCGGRWQLPWIQYLKEKGHKIILVDPNESPLCLPYSDVFFKCDVKDTDKILDYLSSGNFAIDFVTSEQTDVSTLPVAILSESLGTYANPHDAVQKFTNKYECRAYVNTISKKGIPAFGKAKTMQEVIDFRDKLNAPVMIKPVDAQSSRGIAKIDPETPARQVQKYVKETLQFSSRDYCIVEEFIVGKEITLEGIYINNKHYTLTGSNKKHFRMGIASDLYYPLSLPGKLMDELLSFHNNIIERSGLKFGITHSEYLVNEQTNQFWLVEMACRGGGSLIPSHLVPWVTGIPTYDLLYKMARNEIPENGNLRDLISNKVALLHFFEFRSGIVVSISGLTECANLPGVELIDLEFKKGDEIFPAADDRGRQGFVIILAESEKAVTDTLKRIYDLVKIEYA